MKPVLLAIAFSVLGAAALSAEWARVSIAYVEGSVSVDGKPLQRLKAEFAVKNDSVVRTEKGRAEVVFGRGDTVFLGENSSVRANHDINANSGGIEIVTASAVVITGEVGPAVSCEETVHLSDAGIFRCPRAGRRKVLQSQGLQGRRGLANAELRVGVDAWKDDRSESSLRRPYTEIRIQN
jgi:hypothetical protein